MDLSQIYTHSVVFLIPFFDFISTSLFISIRSNIATSVHSSIQMNKKAAKIEQKKKQEKQN